MSSMICACVRQVSRGPHSTKCAASQSWRLRKRKNDTCVKSMPSKTIQFYRGRSRWVGWGEVGGKGGEALMKSTGEAPTPGGIIRTSLA